VAGAELKEAFLPDQLGLGIVQSDRQSGHVEALYMFEWKPTEVEPSGTYFANNDFGLTGGEFVMLNFGLVDEPADYNVCRTNPAADPRCAAAFPRAADNEAGDSGQYGLAMRYFASELNDTEFGLTTQ
jgi:hypothetical protein